MYVQEHFCKASTKKMLSILKCLNQPLKISVPGVFSLTVSGSLLTNTPATNNKQHPFPHLKIFQNKTKLKKVFAGVVAHV
jgi:hypothetical protein